MFAHTVKVSGRVRTHWTYPSLVQYSVLSVGPPEGVAREHVTLHHAGALAMTESFALNSDGGFKNPSEIAWVHSPNHEYPPWRYCEDRI